MTSVETEPVDTTRQDARTSRRSLLVLLLTVATVAVSVTGAIFTDTQTVSNSIATGTVSLSVTSNNPLPWNISGMAPGDTDGAVNVPVANNGSLELRYAITSTETSQTDPDLAGQLDLWIWDESEEAGNLLNLTDTAGECEGTPSDTMPFLYEGGPMGDATQTINLVGDAAQGGDTGDRVLAGGANEVLCFYLELPGTTDSTYEGLSTSVDLEFEAEQTANNA